MTTITYKGNKGPFRNGTSRADRYAAKHAAIAELITDAARGDQNAQRKLAGSVAAYQSFGNGQRMKSLIAAADTQLVPVVAAMSVDYVDPALIGEELMPVFEVGHIKFKYSKMPRRDHYPILDNIQGAGAQSTPNTYDAELPEVVEEKCIPYEFETKTDIASEMNADWPIMGELDFFETVNMRVAVKREIAYKNLIATPTNYPASNRIVLSNGSYWGQADGSPVGDILRLKEALWTGRGQGQLIAWTTERVWNYMRADAKLLKYMSLTKEGVLTEQEFISMFGLDGLLVTDAKYNSAGMGETPVMQYIWPHHFGIVRVSETPVLRNAAFGYTARWVPNAAPPRMINLTNGVMVAQWWDPHNGGFGTRHAKKAVYEGMFVQAADTSGIIANPYNLS